ncbi:HDOD domain-containing protein [Shewanella maritima]|uniref:HDOD domain-containing protein n=1 Tax=Shewanella maritima TaxID=2520507 RepID=UPI003736A229
MTGLEQEVYRKVSAIIADEEHVLARSGVLTALKKAIDQSAELQGITELIATDPALAAHLLMRANTAQNAGVVKSKHRTFKDALIRLGNDNLYRYSLAFYLKANLELLQEPYRSLVEGYWQLNEDITQAVMAKLYLANEQASPSKIDPDELQTLALFSVFDKVIALTAFASLNQVVERPLSLRMVKSIIDKQQQPLSVQAFDSFDLDDALHHEFCIAHNLEQTDNPDSSGLLLRQVLAKRELLINPL